MHYFWFFLLLFSSSCCCFNSPTPPQEDPRWKYAQRFRQERPTDDLTNAVEMYATELKYEHRLHLENAMVCTHEGIPSIRLEFITQHILELCEARQLLVDVVEGLLVKLNTDYIEPELRPFPFTADQLEIYIDFESFYLEYDDPMYIGWVVLEDGIAFYYAANLKNEKLDCWQSHWEPYYKSRSITYAQRTAEREYHLRHPEPSSSLQGEMFRPQRLPMFRP